MKTHLIAVFLASLLVACKTPNPSPASQSHPNEIAKDSLGAGWKIDSVKMISRINELNKRFVFYPDSIEGGGWYQHKTQVHTFEWWQRREANREVNSLEINISQDGRMYLNDFYVAPDWIFHTSMIAKIGGSILSSQDIPTSDRNNNETSGERITESINYTGGRDGGILDSIGLTKEKVITIRLKGGRDQHDFQLNPEDLVAIQEGYELGNIITRLQQRGVNVPMPNNSSKSH